MNRLMNGVFYNEVFYDKIVEHFDFFEQIYRIDSKSDEIAFFHADSCCGVILF